MPLGFGVLAFGMPINGSLGAIAAVTLLGSLAFSAFGLLLATRARTFEAVSGLMNMAMLPMWLLSGVFFSSVELSLARCSRSSRRCRSRRWSTRSAPWCSRARTCPPVSRQLLVLGWLDDHSVRAGAPAFPLALTASTDSSTTTRLDIERLIDHRRAITPGDVVSDDAVDCIDRV